MHEFRESLRFNDPLPLVIKISSLMSKEGRKENRREADIESL